MNDLKQQYYTIKELEEEFINLGFTYYIFGGYIYWWCPNCEDWVIRRSKSGLEYSFATSLCILNNKIYAKHIVGCCLNHRIVLENARKIITTCKNLQVEMKTNLIKEIT